MTVGDVETELYGLRRAHPGWLILFGAYTHRYVAHGYMLGRPGIWLTAESSAELHHRMALMENTYPAIQRRDQLPGRHE
ncbi:hypothetical protein NE235_24725 [Actinoallomurus spadix]|nr:hypothetical protein [Actinoallomurus spadix]MCO5989314.1 hypothetical protein [Actinoallomurus spadix]